MGEHLGLTPIDFGLPGFEYLVKIDEFLQGIAWSNYLMVVTSCLASFDDLLKLGISDAVVQLSLKHVFL
jgi:hypothetical protein